MIVIKVKKITQYLEEQNQIKQPFDDLNSIKIGMKWNTFCMRNVMNPMTLKYKMQTILHINSQVDCQVVHDKIN